MDNKLPSFKTFSMGGYSKPLKPDGFNISSTFNSCPTTSPSPSTFYDLSINNILSLDQEQDYEDEVVNIIYPKLCPNDSNKDFREEVEENLIFTQEDDQNRMKTRVVFNLL